MNSPMLKVVRPDVSSEEWKLRLELAACYRLFDALGWTELIFNHITVRAPGSEPAYLINPYGLHYNEVTASNLVKIDTEGKKLDNSPYPVNPAGFVIHSAIHRASDKAHCVMHTHTTAGMAVACKEEGLRFDNFYSVRFWGCVGYHDFEGLTTRMDEQPRLVKSLGENDALILRNHGLLVTGPDVARTFLTMWTLQRACEVQMASDASPGPNRAVSREVLDANPMRNQSMGDGEKHTLAHTVFETMLRRHGIRYEDLE